MNTTNTLKQMADELEFQDEETRRTFNVFYTYAMANRQEIDTRLINTIVLLNKLWENPPKDASPPVYIQKMHVGEELDEQLTDFGNGELSALWYNYETCFEHWYADTITYLRAAKQ